jgi:hypothetical protein
MSKIIDPRHLNTIDVDMSNPQSVFMGLMKAVQAVDHNNHRRHVHLINVLGDMQKRTEAVLLLTTILDRNGIEDLRRKIRTSSREKIDGKRVPLGPDLCEPPPELTAESIDRVANLVRTFAARELNVMKHLWRAIMLELEESGAQPAEEPANGGHTPEPDHGGGDQA